MKRIEFRFSKAVLATAFFMLSLWALVACETTPDEEQIQQNLNAMIAALEEGKPAELGKYLHESFQANRHMDAKQVKQMLVMYGMQHASISVTVISTQTSIDPVYTDKATTTISVVVTGFSGRGALEDGSARVVNLEWLKEDDWKLLKADWQE